MGDVAGFIKNRDKFEMLPVTSEFAHLYPSPPGGGLNEVIVRHFLKQLASALSFLRAKQLIHRDLKPQNLLLTPTNYTPLPSDEESENWDKMVGITTLPVLKVADFGFARELQVSSLAETLCGSPLYMAPEILRYEKYDAKADLWSMGTVLYEMISGRPPFRATNHVDLLRKIEEGNDRINFPSRTVASDQLKDLIFGLLKRSPVHRMGFAQFFNHPAVQEDIPGVDPAYKVSRKIVPKEIPPTQAQRRESVVGEAGDTSTSRVAEQKDVGQYEMDYREKERNRDGPSAHELDNEIDLPFARPTRQGTSPPLARPSVEQRRVTIPQAKEQQSNSPSSRTPIHTHFPSTARQETNVQRPSNAAMERHYSSPPFQSHPISPHQRTDTKSRSDRDLPRGGIRDNRDSRERIDPDLVSEYVVIEKRSVEVNALADELAASPRVGIQTAASNASNAALARRSSSGRPPSRPSSSGKSMPPQARSLEKKYGASPGSAATSALARALTLAPFRIFGMGSPKYSPPPQPSSFPTYTPPGYGAVVMTNAAKIINLSEEDQAIVNTLESCASKGDVVYHFAAVKYSQLVPMAPGIPQGLSLLPPSEGEGPEASNSEFDLTPEAVVMLAEQALVLYVKCISLLNRAMQIAGKWWSRTNLEPNGAYHRSHAAEKINGTVQWIRQRFNEAMEKADYVRLKLKEAHHKAQGNSNYSTPLLVRLSLHYRLM